MSRIAQDWAETAPVADTYERIILLIMAGRARKDGTCAFQAKSTLAAAALCDEKTVQRRLTAMRQRGLIGLGDQRMVAYIRADKRPTVYDLLIPRSWYSDEQWAVACAEASAEGREPVDPATRPAIKPPPQKGRKTRSDKGKSRPRKS